MTDGERIRQCGTNARAWAAWFRECNPNCNVSDELMVTWFSNAIEATHDHLQKGIIGTMLKLNEGK